MRGKRLDEGVAGRSAWAVAALVVLGAGGGCLVGEGSGRCGEHVPLKVFCEETGTAWCARLLTCGVIDSPGACERAYQKDCCAGWDGCGEETAFTEEDVATCAAGLEAVSCGLLTETVRASPCPPP